MDFRGGVAWYDSLMPHVLTAAFDEKKNYIILKFTGDLREDREDDFKKDLQEAGELIADTYRETEKKLHILLDMTDFTGNYSGGSLSALVEFAKTNTFFVEKTASFGGSDKVKTAGEVAIDLSNRENIRIFDSEADAVAWLCE